MLGGERNQIVVGERAGAIGEGALGLVPDAARKEDLIARIVDVHTRSRAEKKRLFHAEAHVDDGHLLLIGEIPVHLLVGKSLIDRLLHLRFKDLAIVVVLLGEGNILSGLHIEFARRATHAHNDVAAVESGIESHAVFDIHGIDGDVF